MKFMFNGYIFSFWRDYINVWDVHGDQYRIQLTQDSDNPFIITLVQKRHSNHDHKQLEFERELRET